jgi:hypothetical protein
MPKIWIVDAPLCQALQLIEEQTRKVDQKIDALLLVGGFAGCEYLFKRVKVRKCRLFPPIISHLVRTNSNRGSKL